MNLLRFISLSIFAIYLSGCGTTSIKTSAIALEGGIAKGVVYYLPKSNIIYNVKYKINECSKGNIDIDVSLESVDTKVVRDEKNTFVLNYQSLSSMSKKTDFTAKFYSNGTVKSINIESDDRTSEIIGSAVNSISALALSNIPGSYAIPSVTKGAEPVKEYLCSDDVKGALNKEGNLKLAKKSVLEKLEVVIKAIKELRKDSNIDLAKLDKKLDKLDKLKTEYDKAESEYAGSQDTLSFKKSYEKSDNYATKENNWTYELKADKKPINKWLNSPKNQKDYANFIIDKTKLTVSVKPDDLNINSKSKKTTAEYDGLIYRIPVIGTVKVELLSVKVLHDKQYPLPGLGQIAYIPYSNTAFQENTLGVLFNENGVITELKYKTNAPAERIASTFENVATKVAEYKEEKRNKPLNDLKSQVDYKKLLNEYSELSKEPNNDLKKLKLEIELRELSSKLDTLSTDELTRELQRIKIQQEILELSDDS